MPVWITSNENLEYFFYSKNLENMSRRTYTISARKLLQIADFFNNPYIISQVINNEIIPTIKFENAMLFLEDSFEKLTKGQGTEIYNSWFQLFYSSIDFISKNFLYFLNTSIESLVLINKKVLGEIIEK